MAKIPSRAPLAERDKGKSVSAIVEEVLEKKIEDICILLCTASGKKSRVYEDIIHMVEKSLFKVALKHSNNVKSASAAYLGINRNTFHKKMTKLGLDEENGR